HPGYLREPNRACFPVRCEVRVGAIIAIPDIVNRDLVALDLGPGGLCNVRLPRTIVARFQRQPPRNNNGECTKDDGKLQKFPANKYDGGKNRQQERNRCERARLWKIKIERAECPCDTQSSRDRGQRIEGESEDFHPCQPTQCKRRERRLFLALTDERDNQISKDRLTGCLLNEELNC